MRPSGTFVKTACGVLACGLALAGASQQHGHRAPAKSAASTTTAKPAVQPDSHADAIRENNIGIALMERQEFSDALPRFQRACILNPQSDVGCLNMGIALLSLRRYDDAANVLAKSAEHDPQNPRPWFDLALLARESGKLDDARQDFEKVASLDPDDADTQYFLGYLAAEAQDFDRAAVVFKRAVALDPFHASAEYGLAQAEQHIGDSDAAKAHLARFQHITASGFGKPMRFLYGEQGKYSRAQEMIAPPQTAPRAIPVHFVDVTSLSGLARSLSQATPDHARLSSTNSTPTLAGFLGSGACVFDYDGDGRPDIFLVNADGNGHAALYRNTGKGTFLDVTKAAKLDFSGERTGCAVGDYDNDGHPDLAVGSSAGVFLFHNQGDGTFVDVTESAGVRTGGLVLGLTFVDYDGDGDLDLYVTRFNDFPLKYPGQPFLFPLGVAPPGNVLWRNQGNRTFVDVTKELGAAGDAPTVGALAVDVNNNRAVDLVLTGWEKFPALLLNQREGPFRVASSWAISMPGPTAGAAALDFDQDGWIDLAFTHWAPPGISVWRNVGGKSFERVPLKGPGWMRGWGIAALDYDNDGWTDLVAVGDTFSGEGRIALFRNEGAAGFRDVTHETGLDRIVLRNPRSVMPLDFDGDGAMDLLITQNNLPPVLLKNVGGVKNGWLQIALNGDPDNRLGIGARVETFAGAQRQTVQVPAASGYLGQGPAEISVGLGPEDSADVVRVLWPGGDVQSQIQVGGGKRTVIVEGANP